MTLRGLVWGFQGGKRLGGKCTACRETAQQAASWAHLNRLYAQQRFSSVQTMAGRAPFRTTVDCTARLAMQPRWHRLKNRPHDNTMRAAGCRPACLCVAGSRAALSPKLQVQTGASPAEPGPCIKEGRAAALSQTGVAKHHGATPAVWQSSKQCSTSHLASLEWDILGAARPQRASLPSGGQTTSCKPKLTGAAP
jgi:hypothetical protein